MGDARGGGGARSFSRASPSQCASLRGVHPAPRNAQPATLAGRRVYRRRALAGTRGGRRVTGRSGRPAVERVLLPAGRAHRPHTTTHTRLLGAPRPPRAIVRQPPPHASAAQGRRPPRPRGGSFGGEHKPQLLQSAAARAYVVDAWRLWCAPHPSAPPPRASRAHAPAALASTAAPAAAAHTTTRGGHLVPRTPPVASLLQDGSPPVEAPLGFAREPPPARQIAGLHENCAERQMAAAAPNESGEGPDEPPPPPRHRHEGGA